MSHHYQDALINSSDTQTIDSLETERLLKRFIQHGSTCTPTKVFQTKDHEISEIMFESRIDGTHYYLIRCQPKPNDRINLSPRERAIAELIARGLPNKSIADELGISSWTVATYIRRIFSKLSVTSRTAMVARFIKDEFRSV